MSATGSAPSAPSRSSSTRASSASRTAVEPDVSREQVAEEAGRTLAAIRAAGSRGAAVELMEQGVRAVCLRLWLEGRLDGVLCLGGAEGALLGAGAMQALPVGVPKVIVSPAASGQRAFAPVRR